MLDEWLRRAAEMVGIAVPIIGGLIAWIRRQNDRYDRLAAGQAQMALDLAAVSAALKNNGGKTVKDTVDRVDERTERMAHDLGVLTGRFDEHVRNSTPTGRTR